MTRKLLPYEHQLIQALDVTQEEYLGFLSAQKDYSSSIEEQGKIIKAEAGTVALVLTIIGTLLQVASVLLAPKPSQANRRQQRDQIFAPRIGFNSTQELAKYGDTVNLIYTNTNDNPNGGVRVATSLIWSAIHSEGSSQFMQMLLVLGAGQIPVSGIDQSRLAFGQTPIRQFAAQRTWTYFNGSGGRLNFTHLIAGTGSDPMRIGASPFDSVYRVNPQGTEKAEGFSQAFSPTTLTKCGVYFPIPINVNVLDRNENGKLQAAPIEITINQGFLNFYWRRAGRRPIIEEGVQFSLTFAQSFVATRSKQEVFQTAAELRRSLFSGLDASSTYKLGSAKFRIASPIASSDLDGGPISVTFVCVERGSCPEDDYETTDYKQNEDDAVDTILFYQRENERLQNTLVSNTPIFLNTDIGAGLTARYNDIQLRLAALIDYEEDGNKAKNFSDIDDNPIYPYDIRSRIWHIDGLEAGLESAIDKGKKKEVKNYNKAIKREEKILRRQFIDYYDGNYKRTRKARLAEIEELRKQAAQFVADNAGQFDYAAMEARNAQIVNEISANNLEIQRNQRILDNPENWNDYFHTKCLVKIEEASYETVTQCNIIDFALRARVFKRINGRAKKYGEKKEETFKNGDNGTKTRVSLFWVLYRRSGTQAWTRASSIFAIRRGSDIDNYVSLKFRANDNEGKWQFHFEPVAETASEMREFGFATFAYIENNGPVQVVNNPDGTRFVFTGFVRAADFDLPPLNNNPSQTDEWGLFSTRSDTSLQFSFDNGPEIEIKAVTEQRTEALSTYPGLYKNLALLGFNAYSGQGVQDLRSISAFVTQGRLVRRITDNGTYPAFPDGASSYAPDIFLDTVLDGIDGIGRYAKVSGIDVKALALAKRFCIVNKLFMDCVIAEQVPWRQFWAEVAPFSLLELGRIGGKETLVPAVPCDNAGNIKRRVDITALFNAGNILEDSYKEEYIDYGSSVQDLIATVIYRATEQDGFFPRNSSVDIKLKDTTEVSAIRETFDLSQFVTTKSQAILFGKLLCNQRRHIRKAVEFKTFPTDSVISPGAYIYLDVGQMQWDGIHSGRIEAGGVLNTPVAQNVPNGIYSVLLYKPGEAVVTRPTITVNNNTVASLSSYQGWLFVLGNAVKAKRVFRVSEVQMDEEGEVTVKALEHPCDANGDSKIANFDNSLFSIV